MGLIELLGSGISRSLADSIYASLTSNNTLSGNNTFNANASVLGVLTLGSLGQFAVDSSGTITSSKGFAMGLGAGGYDFSLGPASGGPAVYLSWTPTSGHRFVIGKEAAGFIFFDAGAGAYRGAISDAGRWILGLGAGGDDGVNLLQVAGNAKVTGSITATKAIIAGVSNLTDAATIAVDASLGNIFRVTLGGNRTLGAPTNPTDGQIVTFEITQDATGSRTLAYNAAYAFGTSYPSPVLSAGAGKVDRLMFIYAAVSSKWGCINVALGF